MHRLSAMILALACIGVLLTGCVRKSTPTPAPASPDAASSLNTIRIGTDATFPPFEAYDANTKEFTGFDIELMRAVAAKAGLDVAFVNVNTNQLLSGVLNCDYDGGISAISMTDALRQQIAFSDPYLTVGHVVVVKKGNITVTDRDHLSGMTIGAQKGANSAAEAQTIADAQLIAYPSVDGAFPDLIAGNIDAVIASKPRAQIYASIPANDLKIVGDAFGGDSIGIAICNRDPELVQKINDGLAAVKADGTLDKLTRKWLKNLVP
jgi:polar amino acid transport system substrate-binding protein